MRLKRVFLSFVVTIAACVSLAAGSRVDKAGWIIVRLQGTPQQLGYEHGQLLAPEIQDALTTLKGDLLARSGKDWSWYRENAQRMFWPKLDDEYKQEITAIAEGAKSKGDNLDATDILAMNGHVELWMYYLPLNKAQALNMNPVSMAPNACSAFVATGSETADGKVVMGQNFWWDYIMGERWHVIFDITPEHGNHFMMDSLPGLIMSGTDWAINSSGIALTETTISDFVGFDPNGTPEFERMRKAVQYSNNLSDVCNYLETGNNGAYANTWLMADTKSNEIGKLELGLKNVNYIHTTDGYYFGANFPENPKLIAQEAPNYSGEEEPRKQRWIKTLTQYKGKVTADLAKQFVSDSYDERTGRYDGEGGALCGKSDDWGAVSARVLTTDMVKNMQFWARMGIPDGSPIDARRLEADHPELRGVGAKTLPASPWTIIQ